MGRSVAGLPIPVLRAQSKRLSFASPEYPLLLSNQHNTLFINKLSLKWARRRCVMNWTIARCVGRGERGVRKFKQSRKTEEYETWLERYVWWMAEKYHGERSKSCAGGFWYSWSFPSSTYCRCGLGVSITTYLPRIPWGHWHHPGYKDNGSRTASPQRPRGQCH